MLGNDGVKGVSAVERKTAAILFVVVVDILI